MNRELRAEQPSDSRPISIDKVDWRHINFVREDRQTDRETDWVTVRQTEIVAEIREGTHTLELDDKFGVNNFF